MWTTNKKADSSCTASEKTESAEILTTKETTHSLYIYLF